MAKNKRVEIIVLVLILIGAGFFRLVNVFDLRFFTYDQARDVLYIKRILDGKLRLIGTQSSIPGLYTGPFYYYLMAPFLALFRLNPVGLDLATGLIDLGAVYLIWRLLRETTRERFLPLLGAGLYAFSPLIVIQMRFSWNPNPLPFFTMLILLSLKRIFIDQKIIYWPILGLFMGMAVNFHYSALAFFFVLFLMMLVFRFQSVTGKTFIKFLLAFSLFVGPLLLFDFRHGFINSRNIGRYFLYGAQSEIPAPPFFFGLWQKAEALGGLVFNLPDFWLKILTGVFFVLGGWFFFREQKQKKSFFSLVFLTLIGGITFSGLYRGSFFNFYLTFLYPVIFLMVILVIKRLSSSKVAYLGLILVLGLSLVSQAKVLIRLPVKQRRGEQLAKVARIMAEKINKEETFNLVAAYKDKSRFDHNAVDYRYFLEANEGVQVPGWDVLDYQNASILYVISEVGEIDPLKLGFWEMGLMGELMVEESWEIDKEAYLYRLEKEV